MQKESAEMLALANQVIPGQKFATLCELTNLQLALIRSIYFPEESQELQMQKQPPSTRGAAAAKPPKAYQPWSDERKFQNRIRRARLRIEKDYSIPELKISRFLEHCAQNAQYLGLCLLPILGIDRCQVSFNISQITALEKEKMLRNHKVQITKVCYE
jgi:hypothetical protein